jgi:hypothetical protein
MQRGMAHSQHCGYTHAEAETQKDSDSAEPGQRAGVQVALLRGNGDQAVGSSVIAHVPRQDERRQETGKKQPQTNKGQLRHLDTKATTGSVHLLRVWQRDLAAKSECNDSG